MLTVWTSAHLLAALLVALPHGTNDAAPPNKTPTTVEKTPEELRAEALAKAPPDVRACVQWCVGEHRRQAAEQLKTELDLTRRLLIGAISWRTTSAWVFRGWEERVNNKGKTEIVFQSTKDRKRLMEEWADERHRCSDMLDSLESGAIAWPRMHVTSMVAPSIAMFQAAEGTLEVQQILGPDTAVLAFEMRHEPDFRFVVHGFDMRNKVDGALVKMPEEPMWVTTERGTTVLGASSQLHSITPAAALLAHPAAADTMRAEGENLKRERAKRKAELKGDVAQITAERPKN